MKRFRLPALLIAAGLLAGAAAPASAQKVGFVNSQQLIAQAPGTADVQKTLQGEVENYRTELSRFETQLDSMQTAFEQQQANLSATVRQQRQQELQQRFAAYQQRQQELQQTAQRREQELVAPIMTRIRAAIDQVRTAGGYAIIFDSAATGIASADPALDLTQQVLDRLKAAPAGGR